jgi:hypothetical protein
MKQNEHSMKKESHFRNTLAKQRFQENKAALFKKRLRKIDIDRCPLLSKPSDSYKSKMANGGASHGSDNTRDQLVAKLEPQQQPTQPAAPVPLSSQLENSVNNYDQSENNFASSNSDFANANVAKNKPPSGESGSRKKEKSLLRNIYKFDAKVSHQYEHLYLEEHVADLFVALTIGKSRKFMNHEEFQNFAK